MSCRHPRVHALDLMLIKSYWFTITLHHEYLDLNWCYEKNIFTERIHITPWKHCVHGSFWHSESSKRCGHNEVGAVVILSNEILHSHGYWSHRVRKVASSGGGGDIAPLFLAPMLMLVCKFQTLVSLSPYQERLFGSHTVRNLGSLQTLAYCRHGYTQRPLVTSFGCIEKSVHDNCRNNEFLLDRLHYPWPLGIFNSTFVVKGTNDSACRCFLIIPSLDIYLSAAAPPRKVCVWAFNLLLERMMLCPTTP